MTTITAPDYKYKKETDHILIKVLTTRLTGYAKQNSMKTNVQNSFFLQEKFKYIIYLLIGGISDFNLLEIHY